MFKMEKFKNTDSLYSEIDSILAGLNIGPGEVSPNIQHMAVAHTIHKMIKVDRWFDITVLAQCFNLCQLHVSDARLQLYKTIHCIHWSEMTPVFRQSLVAMIFDDLRPILKSIPEDDKFFDLCKINH